MLASSRLRSEPIAAWRPGAHRRLVRLALLGLALAGFAALSGLDGVGGIALASTPSPEPTALGDRIHARFRVWVEDESIRLRPIEGDPAIRSIALEDEEEEATVNGKAFSNEELRAFLGKDGELVAELAALDSRERRAALGVDDGDSEDR
ncbi:MAG: hypothetical protein ABIU84_16845, partial [Thermoanaerobaculia bacterium]